MSLALVDDQSAQARVVCDCHGGETLLAKLDRRGLWLHCRRCRDQHCFPWRLLLRELVRLLPAGHGGRVVARQLLHLLPYLNGSEPSVCSPSSLDNGGGPSVE